MTRSTPSFFYLACAGLLCMLLIPSVLADKRQRMCGSDSDCVTVRADPMAQMIIDGLDLARSTPQDVLDRLPSWFGPEGSKRGLDYGTRRLVNTESLQGQGVQLGSTLQLFASDRDDL